MGSPRGLKFGVIGCGNVANNYYLPYISREYELVATCDLVAERARRSAALWGARRWYSDPEKILRDEEVEAVIIATSHDSHAPLAIRAAEEGRHFILQKPMALTVREAEEVSRAVKRHGVKAIVEPSEPFFSPLIRALKENMGAIGYPCLSIWYTGHSGPSWSEAFLLEERGGGTDYDLGVYDVSRLLYLFGEPREVSSTGITSLKERPMLDAEDVTRAISGETYGKGIYYFSGLKPTRMFRVTAYDNVVATLLFDDGHLAAIFANYVTFGRLNMPQIQIYGSKGSISVPSSRRPEVSIATREGVKVLGREEIGDIRLYYYCSVDHLVQVVLEDLNPLPSADWGLKVTRVLLAIRDSAKRGEGIALS